MDKTIADKSLWMVGGSFSGTDDQSERFIREGIWENGHKDKNIDEVKSINPGDFIALKSSYTLKNDLPFDNRGHIVSAMSIKARGVVTENLGDGHIIKVTWEQIDPPKIWYFFTYRSTISIVRFKDWKREELFDFIFNDQKQDIERFRNAPYWKERFGDSQSDDERFYWTKFYAAIADALLKYKNNREPLVKAILDIADNSEGLSLSSLQDKNEFDEKYTLNDICPFTVFGIFNKQITNENRSSIASKLAKFLDIDLKAPTYFSGIPVLDNRNSWFFGYKKNRKDDDIDHLWSIFELGICSTNSESELIINDFEQEFDIALSIRNVGWKITMGLYWIRPWSYITLDSRSRNYIKSELGISFDFHGPKNKCNAKDYLEVISLFESKFQDEDYPIHSFPELSLAAWNYKETPEPDEDDDDIIDDERENTSEETKHYSIDDIVNEGCFIERSELERMLHRLSVKKNLILQGPPGTGKTWLAKRLAYALLQKKDNTKVKSVQFHPNLTYEDFIRGWRPSSDGKLTLVDGPFMTCVNIAINDPSEKYVIVIEEINRGNPEQIFGEMLTLLESDKRNENEALELCHKDKDGKKVFIPENLYVIGTMNIADRSLAIVDFALRRRFAFIDLEPQFNGTWEKWLTEEYGMDREFVLEIQKRITALNKQIEEDTNLGKQFRIGHSYVTLSGAITINNAQEWFINIVDTEIFPLLQEYWYDSHEKANTARKILTEGF